MQRIGVFVCHCGSNIAATVDVKKVVEMVLQEPEWFMQRTISICVLKLVRQRLQQRLRKKSDGYGGLFLLSAYA